MARLGVNVDHVATLRQARGGREPDPIAAAVLAELAGADGIVVHLREDRRHIQDRDLQILRQTVQSKLDLEMAADEAMVKIALSVRPDFVTLVPERRQELTTEGGLDVAGHRERISSAHASTTYPQARASSDGDAPPVETSTTAPAAAVKPSGTGTIDT
jgi:pyridoxine 5-phosphate synthase